MTRVVVKTSYFGFRDLSDVQRYYGAHGTAADALQDPSHVQHARGLGIGDHQPTEHHVPFADDQRHAAAEHRAHRARRHRADHRADAEQRTRRGRGHRRHLKADGRAVFQHRLDRRRPSEHRADDERSQRRCKRKQNYHIRTVAVLTRCQGGRDFIGIVRN